MLLKIKVNNCWIEREVDGRRRLLDFLREDLGLTSVKEGCGQGECGACTVLMDNQSVHSCTIALGQVQGKSIETTEGLGFANNLHPLQSELINKGAIQCGYCTPGMLMSAEALLRNEPLIDEMRIRKYLEGNLCRCTGYQSIIEAILTVAKEREGGTSCSISQKA